MYYSDSIQRLVQRWREDAETVRRYGSDASAGTLETCAAQLEDTLRDRHKAPLTLAEAAALGGYSAEHLGRLVRQGKIPNAGRPGAPRIAREHVPIKDANVALTHHKREIDIKQIVRSAITEGAA